MSIQHRPTDTGPTELPRRAPDERGDAPLVFSPATETPLPNLADEDNRNVLIESHAVRSARDGGP